MGKHREGSRSRNRNPDRNSGRRPPDRDRKPEKRRHDEDQRGGRWRDRDRIDRSPWAGQSHSRAPTDDDRVKREYSPPPALKNEYRDELVRTKARVDNKFNRDRERNVTWRTSSPSQENLISSESGPSRKLAIGDNGGSVKVKVENECRSSVKLKRERSPDSNNLAVKRSLNESRDSIEMLGNEELASNLIVIGERFHSKENELNKILNETRVKPDFDLIEKLSEERKRLRKYLKRLRSKAKDKYSTVEWKPKSPERIRRHLEGEPGIKPSFVIADIFKNNDDTQAYFGKFGTLSVCEDLPERTKNKVKVEFFNRDSALKALRSKHPQGILFFKDPFPEFDANSLKEVKQYKAEPKEDIYALKGNLTQLKKESHCDIPKIKREDIKISPEDYKANHDSLFGILVVNRNYYFRTEEDLFSYFVKFGDINSIHYQDKSLLESNLHPFKNIVIYFEAGHSLFLAVNHDHGNDVVVTITDDCLTQNPGERRYVNNDNVRGVGEFDAQPLAKRNGEERCSHSLFKRDEERNSHLPLKRVEEERHNGSPSKRTKDQNNPDFGRDPFYQEPQADRYGQPAHHRPIFGRKQSSVPYSHHKFNPWSCVQCGQTNSAEDILYCYTCKELRPGNWRCERCEAVNTPDKLRCHKRKCGMIRRGNWLCPDPDCQRLNWGRSLQCHRDRCEEPQPGAWVCTRCNILNFRGNDKCFKCNAVNAIIQDKEDFERNAEIEKQKEALKKIQQSSSGESSLRPSVLQNQSLMSQPEPEVSFHSREHRPKEHRERPRNSENKWRKEFETLRREQEQRRAEAASQARVVQGRLLALVGEEATAKEAECIDLGDEEDEVEDTPAVVVPIPAASNTHNPNLVPIGVRPTKGKSRLEMRKEVVGLMDDSVLDTIRHGTEQEQEDVLKKFNIVMIQQPQQPQQQTPKKVVEVNLVDDSDDELGKYSDGEDEDEVAGVEAGGRSEDNRQLIEDIVRGDLEAIRSQDNGQKKGDDESDDDVIILDG